MLNIGVMSVRRSLNQLAPILEWPSEVTGDEMSTILRTATIHAEHGGDDEGNVWETPKFEGDNAFDGVPPVFIV